MKNRRIVIDIIVVAVLLMTTIAGCMNGAQTVVETTASIPESSVSDVSETDATTTTEKETTVTTTVDLFEPDPTYEEAAAHVRDLFAEGNSAEQVIAILMEEGRTEFDATALVNSVLMEDEGSNSGSGNSSGSSGSNADSGNSSSGTSQGSDSSGSGTSTQQTTAPTSGGSTTQTQEPTTTTQASSSGNTTPTSETTKATETVPETTPIPTKVKQTVYMKIIWSVDTRETAEAMGIDLNAERPEAVGIVVYACDSNGNFNGSTVIDSSDVDAAELSMYAEADAILVKYGITDGCYSYTAYKFENEYLYD
jgi:hypothetical protein